MGHSESAVARWAQLSGSLCEQIHVWPLSPPRRPLLSGAVLEQPGGRQVAPTGLDILSTCLGGASSTQGNFLAID